MIEAYPAAMSSIQRSLQILWVPDGWAQSGREPRDHSEVAIELTFFGDPFECLDRALDPILKVVTVRRQQPNDLVAAACRRAADIAHGKINRLPDVVFMSLQRHSPVPEQASLARSEKAVRFLFHEKI